MSDRPPVIPVLVERMRKVSRELQAMDRFFMSGVDRDRVRDAIDCLYSVGAVLELIDAQRRSRRK